MPFDASGNYTRVHDWTTDRDNNIKIQALRMDQENDDIAAAFNQVMLRSGVAAMTGDLDLGQNSITGLENGTVSAPAIQFSNDTQTGFYLSATGRLAMTAGCTKRLELTGTAVEVTGELNVSGNLNAAASVDIGSNLIVDGTSTFSGLASFFGNVLLANANPSITFNTGGPSVYVPGVANTVAISTSGSERLRITSTGNVGIGDNNPASRLAVAGNILMSADFPALNFNTGGPSISLPAANTLIFSISGSERVRLNSSGDFGIGVNNPGYTLDLVARDTTAGIGYGMRVRANATANAAAIQFTDNGVSEERGIIVCGTGGMSIRSQGARSVTFFTNGVQAGIFDSGQNLTVTQNITAFSDERLKENVTTIDKALDKVMHMRGVLYTRKDTGHIGTGVIAQEMLTVMPEVVHAGEEYLSVAYGNLVGVLIEAIKELKTELDELRASAP